VAVAVLRASNGHGQQRLALAYPVIHPLLSSSLRTMTRAAPIRDRAWCHHIGHLPGSSTASCAGRCRRNAPHAGCARPPHAVCGQFRGRLAWLGCTSWAIPLGHPGDGETSGGAGTYQSRTLAAAARPSLARDPTAGPAARHARCHAWVHARRGRHFRARGRRETSASQARSADALARRAFLA
jgi:hypothetical protein